MCHAQTTYYVATNGTTGNNGTSTATPWSLGKLNYLTTLPSNSIILIQPGVYEETNTQNTTAGPVIYSPYVTIKSQVKWGAVLRDSGNYGIQALTNNVTIDGLRIVSAYKTGISCGTGGVTISSNLTVQNCWIQYCGTNPSSGIGPSGIVNTYADNQLLQYNLIEYIGSTNHAIYDHGIYIAGNNLTINNNVIRYCVGAGIQLNDHTAGSYGSSNVMIFNNLIYGNGNWGMYLSSDNSNIVSTTVFNNTVVNNGAIGSTTGGNGGIAIALESVPPGSNYLYCSNNILIDTYQTVKIGSRTQVAVTNADYNIMALIDNLPTGGHSIVTNFPGFVNPSAGLYWLKLNSCARNMAFTNVFPATNFWGQPQTNSLDIGAFQFQFPFSVDTRTLDPSPNYPDYWAMQYLSPPRIMRWTY